MKNRTIALATLFSSMILSASLEAQINMSVVGNSTSGSFSAWVNPFTDSSTAGNANISGFNSAEGNYGGASLFSLGQSWTASSSGTLTDIQILITGTAPVTFNVAVYDAGAVTTFADTGSATYTPGGNVSANLLQSADSTGLTWSGFTQTGATAADLDFALSGLDQISITAGHEYIFEINSTASPANMQWLRMANNAIDYAAGQAFRQRSSLNGNNMRDMSLAVNVQPVPEPVSLGLLGMGALASLMVLRRKNG